MGTLGGGDGGSRPDNGGHEGLPGLPPEWGTVVIPDDPAELATEAAEVRRELRRHGRRDRWRRRLGLPPRKGEGRSPLALPILIMAIAVLTTLTSLFAIAWPGLTRRPTPGSSVSTSGRLVPDLTLTDASNAPVKLRDVKPAAILLLEGCGDCSALVTATAQASPAGVTVLAVGRTVPTLPTSVAGLPVRALADPAGALRTALQLGQPPAGAASVVLVAPDGQLRQALPAATTVDPFRAQLSGL